MNSDFKLNYKSLVRDFKINIKDLPKDIKANIDEIEDNYANAVIKDDKELFTEISELDNSVVKKIKEWLEEDIGDDNVENEIEDVKEESESEEENETDNILSKLKGALDNDYRITITDLRILLGRKPKYPLEIINEVRLVKILFKPYYQVRNVEALKLE